jgi:hypothetical protein
MHQPERPQANSEPIESLALPPITSKDIDASRVFQLADMADTPRGAWNAFKYMTVWMKEEKLRDCPGSAEWFAKIQADTSNDPDLERQINRWVGGREGANSIESEPRKDAPHQRASNNLKKEGFSREILELVSLSKEQDELRQDLATWSDHRVTFIDGFCRSLVLDRAEKKIAARSRVQKQSGDYLTLAIDAWLQSAVEGRKALSKLVFVLDRLRGEERALAVRLTEDVIKTRSSVRGNPAALVTRVAKILPDRFSGVSEVPPEQYERMNLYPGDFYYAWSKGDTANALRALRCIFRSEEKMLQFAHHGLGFPIRYALSRGERELAWHLYLSTDGYAVVDCGDILRCQELPQWTARAPLIPSKQSPRETALTNSPITRAVLEDFVFSIIRGEFEDAERVSAVLSHLVRSPEEHLPMLQLLRAARGDPDAKTWSGFTENSPFLCWFQDWRPFYGLWRLVRENDCVTELNPRMHSLLKRMATEASKDNVDVERECEAIVFSSLLVSCNLDKAAYSFLEGRSFSILKVLARTLEDDKKAAWVEEVDKVFRSVIESQFSKP